MSLRNMAIRWIRDSARKFGIEVRRFHPDLTIDLRRQRVLESRNIQLILDVGANIGQYGQRLRHNGYRGELLSFEPLSSAFRPLEARAKADGHWQVVRSALGDHDGEIAIHIAANSYSSSALPMLERHLASAPDSVYLGEEQVPLRRLDTVFAERGLEASAMMLKLDVQGFEKQVISGASHALRSVQIIESELSLVPLYEGQALFAEIIELLRGYGFRLIFIEPGFADAKSGELLQVDGLFVRG